MRGEGGLGIFRECGTTLTMSQVKLTIRLPGVRKDGDHTYLFADYDGPSGGTLWFRSGDDEAVAVFNPALSDAFLPVALLMSMESGSDLHFEGAVSDTLAESAAHHLGAILAIQNPTLRPPAITFAKVVHDLPAGKGVGTGLSCGVDSFAAVWRHHHHAPSPGTRLTHLTQFSHAQRRGEINGWDRRMPRFRQAAAAIGLPLLTVGTNFAARLSAPHTMSHVYLNAACALAIGGVIGRYYYASTFQYRDVHVRQTSDIAHADPIVLPLLSSRQVAFVSTGSETPRTAKTARVTEVLASREHLEVCTKTLPGVMNCSTCYKCLRTMATLDLLGRIEDYGAVFDLQKWKAQRSGYARKVLLTEGNPYFEEIKALDGEDRALLRWAGGEKRMQAQRAYREKRQGGD